MDTKYIWNDHNEIKEVKIKLYWNSLWESQNGLKYTVAKKKKKKKASHKK